jgi:hypothetical protein
MKRCETRGIRDGAGRNMLIRKCNMKRKEEKTKMKKERWIKRRQSCNKCGRQNKENKRGRRKRKARKEGEKDEAELCV